MDKEITAETKTEQIARIEAFLRTKDASFENLSKGRQKQFLEVDSTIQELLKEREDARKVLQSTNINVLTISNRTNIARKTFYNNELLKFYVESYSTDDGKTASAAELQNAKEKIAELEEQLQKVFDRDIDTENLWQHNADLQKEVNSLTTQFNNLNRKYEELIAENTKLRQRGGGSNLIPFPNTQNAVQSAQKAPKKRYGTNPDTFNLGISYGTTLDFNEALAVAEKCGTHTIMVSCDNEYFDTPTASTLRGYNIVIHGPLNINLASPDPHIRKTTVKRMLAIIKKCNEFHSYISSFVLHPGSADNINDLVESLKELLPVARFKIAIETMAGKGKQLCSTLEQINALKTALSDYATFSFCLDTCHISDAGFSLEDADAFITQFTSIVPIDLISCIHINDSMNEVGSHKDYHAVIGTGNIPVKSLARLTTFEEFYDIPKIIESSQDYDSEELTFSGEMKLLLETAEEDVPF